jgi:hypothetical protein
MIRQWADAQKWIEELHANLISRIMPETRNDMTMDEAEAFGQDLLDLLVNASPPPSGEAGEVTDEMVERAARDFAQQALPKGLNGEFGRVMGMAAAVKFARKCIRYGLSLRALPAIKEPTDE